MVASNWMVVTSLLWLGLSLTSAAVDVEFKYHNYEYLTQVMDDVAQAYPEITELISIGQSVEGRDLWVMQMGKTPREHILLQPQIKFIGNIHGNEVISRETLLHLINYLAENYGSDDRITKILDNARIHILPSMNPDAFEWSRNNHSSYFENCQGDVGRNNSNNINLNRNFPDYFQNFENEIQAETQAIMDWLKTEQFVLSGSFHGGALCVSYAYDNYLLRDQTAKDARYSATDDDDVFIYLSLIYANAHARMSTEFSCPVTNFSFTDGITNGADWYYLLGGMGDYSYGPHGCPEVTVELSCCKYPPEDELPDFWNENIEPYTLLLEEGQKGVKGIVKEKDTGTAIKGGKVTFNARNRHPLTTTALGEYWKILLPGDYVIMVHFEGYKDFQKSFTVPQGNEAIRVDVDMEKVACDGSEGLTLAMTTLLASIFIHLF